VGFCVLGMYFVYIDQSQLSDSWRMWRKTQLVGLLALDFFHHPSTTPLLSP